MIKVKQKHHSRNIVYKQHQHELNNEQHLDEKKI